MRITTIDLDLAMNVFQVHGVGATGQVVVRKSPLRAQMLTFFVKLPPCLFGIEACGTSHHNKFPLLLPLCHGFWALLVP
jgi:transposase